MIMLYWMFYETALSSTLSLQEALKLARKQSANPEKFLNIRSARIAAGNKANRGFDTQLSFNYQQAEDEGLTTAPSDGDQVMPVFKVT